jgi:hypothetical protein
MVAEKTLVEEKVTSLEAKLATAEAELAANKAALVETTRTKDAEKARADQAQAKWEADKATLERAKDALADVLLRIEEVEART